MSDLVRVSLTIDKPLYNRLEKMVADSEYTNRSEFIRDLIRNHLVEEEWSGEKELLGTVTLIYDHHARGLSARLTHLQHEFSGKVLAGTHLHLDRHLCAEMIMVRGRGADIKRLTDKMRREKGVLHAKLGMGSTGKKLL